MPEQYFEAVPAVADRRQDVTATIWDEELTFTTASGVFARDGLDRATDVLLSASTPPTTATRLLDLGCGWGPVACVLARACPDAAVDAVDSNTRALDLTRVNAERLGVGDRVRTLTPDQAAGTEDVGPYDEIWSNPPVRIGKAGLHALLLRWLPALAPGGVARLVVGKNLGSDSLQRWLGEQGWPTERQTSVRGFRVLVVRRADA